MNHFQRYPKGFETVMDRVRFVILWCLCLKKPVNKHITIKLALLVTELATSTTLNWEELAAPAPPPRFRTLLRSCATCQVRLQWEDKLVHWVHVCMYTLQEDSMVHVWREHSTWGGGRGWDALPSSAGGVRDMVRPTARNWSYSSWTHAGVL